MTNLPKEHEELTGMRRPRQAMKMEFDNKIETLRGKKAEKMLEILISQTKSTEEGLTRWLSG